ncbi:putative limiting CO2-inducible proteins B/C beta carbonic anhydrase domain-containing protein [Skeletonema marinoi]|uniref:Limiting CO2-inducible proteins B/C beta carbonic anhydrase domain-containing protein n=1 Tax=Skeletonema marinoi TaxID=267567 RepID=A0AAD8Y542_9STRA|nr:putative limiting CO2-inducible proteins B/C beta carbonic anhydrase domain-containing protein [Skeletonema marinoi]
MREDEFLNSTLSISNSLEVVGCSNSRSAATIDKSNSRSLYLSDDSILGNTDMRSMNSQTETIIRHMSTHGSPTGVTSKGESRESTQVKVVSIN